MIWRRIGCALRGHKTQRSYELDGSLALFVCERCERVL